MPFNRYSSPVLSSITKPAVALCIITVATLLIIFSLSNDLAKVSGLTQKNQDFSVIYQFTSGANNLGELLEAQRQLAQKPRDTDAALRFTGLALEQFQNTGNARYLAAAKTALRPWWHEAQPVVEIWLTRARILQTEHQFLQAATDLEKLNAGRGQSLEALLLETDAWRRAGRIDKARKACIAIAFNQRLDLASYCTAEILLAIGDFNRAHQLAKQAAQSKNNMPVNQRIWALAIYADSQVAIGEPEAAAQSWTKIMRTGIAPVSYVIGFADVLLKLERWTEVIKLLDDAVNTDAILLRLVRALKKAGDSRYLALQKKLEKRMRIIARSSSADLHLHELALFAFWIEDDPGVALKLALRNWELQKSWEDTELVLQLARLTGDAEVVKLIESWRVSVSTPGAP